MQIFSDSFHQPHEPTITIYVYIYPDREETASS
jgi:hypothetical protein